MALTYSDLNAIATSHFNKGKMAEQVYEENVLLDKILAGGRRRIAGGSDIKHSIRYKEFGQAKGIDPDAVRNTVKVDTRTQAIVDWKYYVADTVMTWAERVANNGDEAIINLMADKYKEAMQDLNERISDDFFQSNASTTSDEFDGFYSIVQATSSDTTYAGISSGDASAWVAGLYDTTTTTMALFGTGSLEAGLRACWFRRNFDEYVIMMTKANAGIYASKLQPGERRQPQTGKAGAKTWATDLFFMGIPVLADAHVPANDVCFVALDCLWFYVNSGFDFKFSDWEDDPDRHNALRALCSVTGNFLADTRKKFGAYTAISS
jgi:hypothetical protein